MEKIYSSSFYIILVIDNYPYRNNFRPKIYLGYQLLFIILNVYTDGFIVNAVFQSRKKVIGRLLNVTNINKIEVA